MFLLKKPDKEIWCNNMSEEPQTNEGEPKEELKEEEATEEAPVEAESTEVAMEEEEIKEETSAEVETEEAPKEEAKSVRRIRKAGREPNVVYIGNKPPMNYVMAIVTAFSMSDADQVTLKARGRAISTAVDVAEITRRRFLKDAKVKSIAIGTEEVAPREGGSPRNVSTIEISMQK